MTCHCNVEVSGSIRKQFRPVNLLKWERSNSGITLANFYTHCDDFRKDILTIMETMILEKIHKQIKDRIFTSKAIKFKILDSKQKLCFGLETKNVSLSITIVVMCVDDSFGSI